MLRKKHFTMEREAILTALARRMVKLPTVTKKVLAMYYYENMRLLDIANSYKTTNTRHGLAVRSVWVGE